MNTDDDSFEDEEEEQPPRQQRGRKPGLLTKPEPTSETTSEPELEVTNTSRSLMEQPCPTGAQLHFLRADHPHRPINWLWQLSTYFLQCQRKPWKKFGSMPLRQLVKFRKRLANCETDRQQLELLTNMAHFYEALEIAKQRLDHPTRQSLELLILGGLSVDEIAGKLRILPTIVASFEETFFDVRSRLTDSTFIIGEVIDYHNPDPLTRQSRELRHMAYTGGRVIALQVVDNLCLIPRANHSQNVSGMLRADFEAQLNCKAAVAMRMLPLGDMNVRQKMMKRLKKGTKGKARSAKQKEDERCILEYGRLMQTRHQEELAKSRSQCAKAEASPVCQFIAVKGAELSVDQHRRVQIDASRRARA
jgi:hypothetical protein